jgi:hypothetical protein
LFNIAAEDERDRRAQEQEANVKHKEKQQAADHSRDDFDNVPPGSHSRSVAAGMLEMPRDSHPPCDPGARPQGTGIQYALGDLPAEATPK